MPVTLKSRLPEIALELNASAKAGLAAGAEIIVAAAKERVPVETGTLRDAIHAESVPEGYAVVAGDTDAFYGHMVEHGTTHSPPHPFLIPAAEASRAEVSATISAALREL